MYKLFLTTLFFLSGISQNIMDIPRINHSIKIDGNVSDEEWASIPTLPLTNVQPIYKAKIVEKTEIRICYDDNYIYISGRMYVNKASSVRGNSYERDTWQGDDTFGFAFDTFNDNKNMLFFYTNPNGGLNDYETANEGSSFNGNWNGYWTSEAIKTDFGWFAEVRIPFSTLKFHAKNDEVIMGLIIYRYMAETNGRYMFPDIEPKYRRIYTTASKAQKIRFKNIKQSSPTYFSPYIIGSLKRDTLFPNKQRVFESNEEFDLGLDLKYNIDYQQTVDLTLNTDFAQVEVDDERINTSRFSLFFPEKRRFFQERSELFEFNFFNSNRLFHSRHIGLNPKNRKPIRILGGLRYTGRFNDTDIGLLSMQTEKINEFESENFSVLRFRRSVLNERSYAGLHVNNRLTGTDTYGLTIGADSEINITDQDFVTFKYATTVNNKDKHDFVESSIFYLNYEKRKKEGFVHSIYYSLTGKDYKPAMGFQNRRNDQFLGLFLDYHILGTEERPYRLLSYGLWTELNQRLSDKELESVSVHPYIHWNFKNGASILLSSYHYRENILTGFNIQDVHIKANDYYFSDLFIKISPADGWYIRPRLTSRIGTYFGADRQFYSLSATWIASPQIKVSPKIESNILNFSDNKRLELHYFKLTTDITLNKHFNNRLTIQYLDHSKELGMNFRLRYNFNEGHDLWLVYNDHLNRDYINNEYKDFESNGRTITLKYVNTFVF